MSPPATDPPYAPEGPETEWKERLPRAERVARTLSAFANGVGGRLWVGVRDDGTAIGVADAAETIGELRRISRDMLSPPQKVEVRAHAFDRGQLVVAEVAPSKVRPVHAPGRDGSPTPWVRDGASTRIAPRAVVRAWERASPRKPLDPKERRVLREIAARARFDGAGANLAEIAHAARMGQRGARRALVQLEQAGLVTDRGGGRYGLTPEGHVRARRR